MSGILRKPTNRLIIAGGGTGGHFYPGVAIAEEWLSRKPEADVLFVGTERGIEAREAPALGYKVELLRVLPLKRMSLLQKIKSLLILPFAIWDAYKIIKSYDPDYIIGVGGYAAGPMGAAAWLSGRPLFLLEQNSVPGFTNKILGKLASLVFLTFAAATKYFPLKNSVIVGNPLRKAALEAINNKLIAAERPLLVITGGSQGALALNNLVLDALQLMGERAKEFDIVHQCGETGLETTKRRYQELGLTAEVEPFIKDIVSLFAKAHLVIGRAGATTVCELNALATPAIYIPFPYAADDHQRINAQEAVEAGAALAFDQFKTNAKEIAEAIEKIILNPALQKEMSEAAKRIGKPEAARETVDKIISFKPRLKL